MTAPIPTTEPTSFTAGETVRWTRVFSDYPPSDGWTLKYYFRGVDTLDVTATADGTSGWSVTIAAATTKTTVAGTYQWFAYAEKGTEAASTLERYRVASGVVEIQRNVVEALSGDMQSTAEKELAILDAAIAGRLTADLESYSIGGRAVSKIPLKELRQMRGVLRAELQRLKTGQMSIPVQVAFYPADGTIGSPAPLVLPPWYRYGG